MKWIKMEKGWELAIDPANIREIIKHWEVGDNLVEGWRIIIKFKRDRSSAMLWSFGDSTIANKVVDRMVNFFIDEEKHLFVLEEDERKDIV